MHKNTGGKSEIVRLRDGEIIDVLVPARKFNARDFVIA